MAFSRTLLVTAALCGTTLGCARVAEIEQGLITSDGASAASEPTRAVMPARVISERVPFDGKVPPNQLKPSQSFESGRTVEIVEGRPAPSLSKGKRALARKVAGDGVEFAFVDADVAEAAEVIFTTVLPRSFVVDPSVDARVTFQTTRPLPKKSVLTAFDAVLSTVGATVIDDGQVIRIVPLGTARSSGAPLGDQAGQGGYRLEVAPLQFVKASEIAELLRPIGGEDQVVAADDGRNIVVLAGSDRTLAPLLDVIETFDVDWMAGRSFGVFPLENVDAQTATEEMELIFQEEAAADLAVRFLPLKRINAVIVIGRQPETVRQMVEWLERIDQPSLTDEERVFVYFAQNTDAADLAAALDGLLDRSDEDDGVDLNFVVAADVSNRGAESSPDEVVESPERGDARVRNGDFQTASVNAGGLDGGRVKVVAAPSRNAILVTASPSNWRKLEAILTQLDVPPLQVLLEVNIVEVTLKDELQYGLQWFFQSGNSSFSLSNLTSGAVTAAFPGFNYVFQTSDVRLALSALTDITDVRMVSAPSLMVLNNQTASLQVGDQVPIAVQSSQSVTDPDAPIVNSIQFRDTGVILNVTPRVNNSGLVIAEIEQEVSSVVRTSTSNLNSPTIQQRRLSSTVAVGDGESVTLGGLIQDNDSTIKSGVPGLSEIPFLGAAFRSTSDRVNRTELLVIVTPQIVRDGSDAREATSELRRRMSRISPKRRTEGRIAVDELRRLMGPAAQ
ncbi:MAG: type II secretion system secretin GspD [Rhodobacteraceae bacterium]|nr:type II secretion system secretin GspD [Paracoccaceae bacterium]